MIKSWSTTQAVVALSSGEAELYGIVKGSSEGIGAQSLLKDLGIETRLRVLADASAALGVVNRVGLGKFRHVHTNWLWIQDKNSRKEIEYCKTPGTENPADVLTKPVDNITLTKHCATLGMEFPDENNQEGFQLGNLSKDSNNSNNNVGKDEPDTVIREIANELNAKVWLREDLGTYCLRRSNKTGPRWNNVIARITVDNDSRRVIRIEGKEDLDTQVSYHKQWTHPRNTSTALVYRAGPGEEQLKRPRMRDILCGHRSNTLGSGVSVAAWLRGSPRNSPRMPVL